MKIKLNNLRPCVVDGRRALFHCWSHWSEVIGPSPMVGGHQGGTISGTLAIVEYEDGTVGKVDVCSVRFTVTNGDKIRQRMSDEKLAEILCTDVYDLKCNSCPAGEICHTRESDCHGSLACWLKQEADE